jgi:hypothetical protein
MLIFRSHFHTSAALLALKNHRLYSKVEWERIEAGSYAIVDPVNPGVILYLSEQDYITMIRVAITSNRTLKVLAGPSDLTAESSTTNSDSSTGSSQNSPKELANRSVPFALGPMSSTARRRLQTMFNSLLDRFLLRERTFKASSGPATMEKTSMIKLTVRNVRHWFTTWYNLVSWYSRGTAITTVAMTERNSFGLYLVRILKTRGIMEVIQRFKIILFVINSYLGGKKMTTTEDLGKRVRLVHGLPQCLPVFARHGLRVANKHYIHIWTSVFFAYKGLLGEWVEPNLCESAITQEHPNYTGNRDFSAFLLDFASVFWYNIMIPLGISNPNLRVQNAFFTTHAGPNCPISILGAGLDAFLWFCVTDEDWVERNKSEIEALVPTSSALTVKETLHHIREHIGVPRNFILEWLKATGQEELVLSFRKTAKMFKMSYILAMQVMPHHVVPPRSKIPKGGPIQTTPVASGILGLNLGILRTKHLVLQRLHNLYEAAGKVRTIAIVDYWTNFVLKPLHDWMFDILRKLPQDATFDQEGKTREFASRGYTDFWSLDLKSATDTIPLALYRALFSYILPQHIVDLWLELLVNRDFKVPTSMMKAYPDLKQTQIRYTTGQPMGALTSWASMALIHHAVVLFAAVNVGEIRRSAILSFIDYLVLGDDIVIANRKVAEEYIRLCASFGIQIGLAKSYVSSEGLFNFANQTYKGTDNYSPLSMKEEAQITSLPARAELALRAVRRGWRSITSRSWLSSILKLYVNDISFNRWIRPTMVERGINPTIAWVLSSLLVPGTTRYGFAGIGNIVLQTFFGAFAAKKNLWTQNFKTYVDHISMEQQNALIAVFAQWVNTVYGDFLRNRKRLEVFDEWVSQLISPDIEWLLRRVFQEARKSAFQRWTDKYRLPLKEIQVATRLPAFNIYDVEAATGRPWDELTSFISSAEEALPQVPDFLSHTIEVLTALVGGVGKSSHVQDQALRSFMKLTNVIGMIDHIGSFVTPGIVIPEETSSLEKCLHLTKEDHSGPCSENNTVVISPEAEALKKGS